MSRRQSYYPLGGSVQSQPASNGLSMTAVIAGGTLFVIGIMCIVAPIIILSATHALPTRFYLAFVTSGTTDGAIGSLADADALCMSYAQSSSDPRVVAVTSWTAWLSNGTIHAKDRIVATSNPWIKPDNVQFARSTSKVAESILLSALNANENGTAVVATAWTGTAVNGSSSGVDCAGWTDNDSGVDGTVGNSTSTTETWTTLADEACDGTFPLYCFANSKTRF